MLRIAGRVGFKPEGTPKWRVWPMHFITVPSAALPLAQAHTARALTHSRADLVVVPISAWTGENVVTAPSSLSWYQGPMLFEIMEQSASAVTKPAPGEVAAIKRPVFGPTRISVLRRANKRCTGATDTQKQEEVVEALVQSGMVCEGQVLEAIVVAPITTASRHSRRGHILPKPTTLATFTVVSIQRFDKPRYACVWACFTTSVLRCSSS